MKIKINADHAGVMTLKGGTQMNYGVIRITQNLSKLIYYTDKGLQEIVKPDMNEEEKIKADELKKLDEKILMRMGHVDEMAFSNIQTMD